MKPLPITKRLFIALELPEPCRKTLAKLGPPIRGVRWLHPHQLHLTLAFIGDTTHTLEPHLHEQLKKVHVPPFHLTIQGIGTFGGAAPSVIWAGVGTAHPHLFALHKHLHDALLATGLDPELRSFHPHITIGRCKNVSAHTLRPFLRKHESSEFCVVKFTSFSLLSSHLHNNETLYLKEMRRELA